jgi:hypothetical protein
VNLRPAPLSGARPICRPSNFARLIPARTRSTIRLFSSSAIAPTITTIARPSRPPVSIFSRKLTNSMLRWLNSSSTSRKWRTLLATLSKAATRTMSKRCRRASANNWSRLGRFDLLPEMTSVYSCAISNPRCFAVSRRSLSICDVRTVIWVGEAGLRAEFDLENCWVTCPGANIRHQL